jgi:small conductance mechanosensitive channel
MEQLPDRAAIDAATAQLIDFGLTYGLNLLTAVALLVLGFSLAGWVGRALRRRLEATSRLDRTMVPVIAQIGRYAVLAFTFVLVLSEFGVQTASIITVLGAAGLAIGLALQGTLQNVAAGMMLLFLRPFKIGDYIESGAGSGTVEEIGVFVTQLTTADGIFLSVPNSLIWSQAIANYSMRPTRRLRLAVGISYEDDIDRARDIVMELARSDERVLDAPEPQVVVTGLGESSVDLELRAWINRENFLAANFELTRAVKYALDRAGITIPYPHRQIINISR